MTTSRLTPLLAIAFALALFGGGRMTATPEAAAPARPEGPCDIYAAGGTPCVTAHSTTRALYAAYNGPLYQVKRQSDGQTLDIGVVQPADAPVPDPGGYADAAAADAFCADTLCVVNVIYDQSGHGNHLRQAPPGPLFPGPAKGAFDTQPIADMAPITIGGHKAYGVFMMPGMGFRNNDASGLAIDDEPEGIYYVVDGTHYDSGCCFDYGNSSTNGRAVGTGTMETTYFGTATAWGSGAGPGPWIMADMEAGLFSGYDAKQNVGDPTIDSWRFVTAVVDGGGGNMWDLRGGNAQQGPLTTFYKGVRPGSRENDRYFPMHKQGGLLLGTGGDNGNGSAGTFYEGAMTTGYPSEATTDAVQANIVAARYDVPRVQVTRLTTFTPGTAQDVTVTFANTTGAAVTGARLSLSLPAGWSAAVSGTTRTAAAFADAIAAGASVQATFRVTSPSNTGAGFLIARAEWTDSAARRSLADTTRQRIRNVLPVKINEVRLSGANPVDQFVELYNASASTVDLSGWTLVNTETQWAPVTLATIPAGTRLPARAHYLLGRAQAGLAAPANAGATTVHVGSTAGFAAGHRIDVDGEARVVTAVGTPAAARTTVFIPVSTGPWLTVPAGSTTLPVTSAEGFVVGQPVGIDIGGQFELATVTAVGKAATQTTLAAAAAAGATNVKLAATADITPGDTLTIGTGARKELARVAAVGSAGANGTGVDLAAPLRLEHRAGVDVSDPGTGIGISPATRFPHTSGDAVQALGSGMTLDRPLSRAHAYGAPVVNAAAAEGYAGPPAPAQWFGGTLSPRGGSIALLDATGAVVVDALVYGTQQSSSSANGTITNPEIATLEADQRQGGCIAVVPNVGRGGRGFQPPPTNRSLGRYPDGADADSLCTDFTMQTGTTLSSGSAPGSTNVKVASVSDFAAGQTIVIDIGGNAERAVIAEVGTPGATTLSGPASAGATVLPVAGAAGFAAGQRIVVGSGADAETAIVVASTGGRGGRRGGGPGSGPTVTIAAPLTRAHAAGSDVAGTGLTLTTALTRTHGAGAQVAAAVPTPGAPNTPFRAAR